ncbi:Protein of unknown function [Cotesia congregata]|uniref:Uncharacterized protein n=1 Tax=Cotesia congregata TaxID=51543 RepID=A0A8J2HFX8_COTCN|nr:Protein of unknown function [Cotesia congregata]
MQAVVKHIILVTESENYLLIELREIQSVFQLLRVEDLEILYDASEAAVSNIPEPEFLEEIGNTTVPAGRNIKLACSVKDLGTYKNAHVISELRFDCYLWRI